MKSTRNNETRVAVAGCKDTTYECLKSLIDNGTKIDLLITIDNTTAKKNKVAGYLNLQPFAKENNISLYICNHYSLNTDEDKQTLGSKHIDLLFVIGWQRLIPEWLLEKLSIGAFGMHGASKPLPFGRGRSPMNWSIIQNKKLFITNLFKYKAGVDDGDVLDTQVFDLNQHDTAQTAHYKNTLSMINLIHKNLKDLLSGRAKLKPQMNIQPTYYPKRTESDGCIFWDKDTVETYNLIRAVTRPFPGAFSFYQNNKIKIWSSKPFDTRLFDPYIKPGRILHVFNNGDFVVKTGDGSLLVTDYEAPENVYLKQGSVLSSGDYEYLNPFLYPEESP